MTKKWIGIFGEILLTAGVLILLFLAYQLWFTNLESKAEADRISQELLAQFETDLESVDSGTSDTEVSDVERSAPEGFALVYIPRLRNDVWGTPLLSSVTESDLSKGIGHYPKTELPGEKGNFAIAGHRATNGEPFARFEKLQQGDKVIVRSAEGWFVYRLINDQIVRPNEVWVLNDAPTSDFQDGASLITLTTCDPRWNSYQRWVWWGELVSTHVPDDYPVEALEG